MSKSHRRSAKPLPAGPAAVKPGASAGKSLPDAENAVVAAAVAQAPKEEQPGILACLAAEEAKGGGATTSGGPKADKPGPEREGDGKPGARLDAIRRRILEIQETLST